MAKLKARSTLSAARRRAARRPLRNNLLGAAITGLLATGCGADEETGPRKLSEVVRADLTVAEFKQMCDARAGLTETDANCGGHNSCAGLSYTNWNNTLTEHTCKGINSCGGIHCVDLPKDGGLTGAEVYKETCLDCHGGGEEAADAEMIYKHLVKPGDDLEASKMRFLARSPRELVNVVAFGITGVNADGAFTNMPGYRTEYSRAELERVVEHVLDLEIVAEEQKVLGINREIEPADKEP